MQGGQISIDVLFAIIALAIFFTVLVNTYNEGLTAQVAGQNTKNEAKAMLLDVYAAIGAVQAYGQSIDYISPPTRQAENINLPCTITKSSTGAGESLNSQTLKVQLGTESAPYSGLDLSAIKFTLPDGTTPDSFDCGTAVTISR